MPDQSLLFRFRKRRARRVLFVCFACLNAAILWRSIGICSAGEPFRFPEASYEKGRLRYINSLPVLTVSGSPDEIGRQIGVLALKPSLPLVERFRDHLKKKVPEKLVPALSAASEAYYRRFPEERQREIEAMIKASGADRNLVILANTIFEFQRALVGCSGLLVASERTEDGNALYGRNFDCPNPVQDLLAEHSLVIVYRPTGKKAFAMVTFPGLLASSCGMNEDGLTLGANTVTRTGDGSPAIDPSGMPYSIAAREVLETLGSVDAFDQWIRKHPSTGMGLLLACDRRKQRVYEITTKNIGVREPDKGLVFCTNHFRLAPMAVKTECRRYESLKRSQEIKKLSVEDVARLLHDVHQNDRTIQTMVFEPADLVLHLSIGHGPTSAKPLNTLHLKELMAEESTRP
jgi:isopenicillin-N N-acyltransferase like protein